MFYSTHEFVPPPDFEHCWNYVAGHHRMGVLPNAERARIMRASVVVIFCDIEVPEHLENAKDFAGCLSFPGAESVALVLVPHTVAPKDRENSQSYEDALATLSGIIEAGIDEVVCGEPCGYMLAAHVRSRIFQQTARAEFIREKIEERRRLTDRAQELQHMIDQVVWEYVRVRLQTGLPAIDAGLGLGEEPESVNSFLVGDTFATGQYTKLRKLVNPLKPDVRTGQVLKIISKQPFTNFNGIAQIRRQLQAMQLLSSEEWAHPNVQKFYEAYHATNFVLFRFEDGGAMNLYKRLALREERRMPLGIQKVKDALAGALAGVCHMHTGPKVVHRDIKPENICVRETRNSISVKIVDFETSLAVPPDALLRGVVGTIAFMAPEVGLDTEYSPFPADIWSLANVALEVACGLRVLKSALNVPSCKKGATSAEKQETARRVAEQVREVFTNREQAGMLVDDYLHLELEDLSPALKILLTEMLNVQPDQRWTAEDVGANYEKLLFA